MDLRKRLEQLKIDYIEVIDDLNVQKANGSLSELCNLRTAFDVTFDAFFDSEDIARKYDWNQEEDGRAFVLSNDDIEQLLNDEELQSLIDFYENYIGRLEDELVEFISEDKSINLEDVLSLQEAAAVWGLDDSTLRHAIARSKFCEGEYKKLGRNYIITRAAMVRLYGDPKK
jgi:hypothetical protein